MASALATAGATVALTGRSGQRASSVAAELPGAVGIEPNVRDESSVARAVDQAWSRLGGIDMLVNNAGIGMRTVNPSSPSNSSAGCATGTVTDSQNLTDGSCRE